MIDKEDIIKLARESGFEELFKDSHDWVCFTEEIERFFQAAYAKGQADEREVIAKMFDEPMSLVPFVQNHLGGCMICGFTPRMAADAIRARGETTSRDQQ